MNIFDNVKCFLWNFLFKFVVKVLIMRVGSGQHQDLRLLKNDSNYKYIIKMHNIITKKIFYATNMKGLSWSCYDTAKEAALVVDKYLISKGKQPINVLVKK